MGGIDQKFSSIQQTAFSLDFVGLKTKEELLNLKGAAEEEAARQKVVEEEEARRREKEEKKKRKEKQTKVARLSFAMGGDDDDEEGEEEDEDDGGRRSSRPTKKSDTIASSSSTSSSSSSISVFKKKKALKNPEAETSFLRDPEAEKEQALLRENLKQEWLAEQERVKEEMLEVTYSYWDGSGHRRMLKCKKGITIAKFLEMVRSQVAAEFTDLRGVTSDELMYIKEDLIIPHNYSFYDLILTKARGKSGPLFHFDVHDDVRLTMDARVEKDESHPGKVVERRWYERNKHIFPASRWEIYDPKVQRGGYTVHGGEVQEKKK
jgi:protein FAM50